jgi:plasmid stabilization system protein ParE
VNYWLHPEAQQDLREAAEFYREQAGAALSQSFLAEFEHGVNAILANPKVGAIFRGTRRRYLLRRFPYSIIYQISTDELRVNAVAHQRRRPGYWAGRK